MSERRKNAAEESKMHYIEFERVPLPSFTKEDFREEFEAFVLSITKAFCLNENDFDELLIAVGYYDPDYRFSDHMTYKAKRDHPRTMSKKICSNLMRDFKKHIGSIMALNMGFAKSIDDLPYMTGFHYLPWKSENKNVPPEPFHS